MNRYVPFPAVAAACIVFFSPGRAAAEDRRPSNRKPGVVEPASNWLRLVAVPPGPGGKEFIGLAYWCHKTDCDLEQAGNNSNPVPYPKSDIKFRTGVPVYTLLKTDNDSLVKVPHYRAVPAPWGALVGGASHGIALFAFDNMPAPNRYVAEGAQVANMKIVADGSLGGGDVVVDDVNGPPDNGKPLPMGFADKDAPCTTQGYDQYYGTAWDADHADVDRFFLPIELELERAELNNKGGIARVVSGTLPGGVNYADVAKGVENSNNLSLAKAFVPKMRGDVRAAAQYYNQDAGNGPAQEFSPFERRFLHCRMGFAGSVDAWMAKAAEASANPAPFVQSWRAFLRVEIKHYIDEQTPPPGPEDDWEAYSNKADWDEMVARTKQWQANGKLDAPAAAAMKEEKPRVQSRAAVSDEPPKERKVGVAQQSLQDWLNQQ